MMRRTSIARAVAAIAFFAAARAADAQGSWLPYGTRSASDIAVSPSGVVWLISREPQSIRTDLVLGETRFFTPRGSPARVGVDLNGFPWLVNSDGTVWHFVRNSAGKEDWEPSELKAIDIAVGANGAVWAIDTEQRVVRHRNGKWEAIGGSGVRIAVDPSGNPWVVGASGQVSRWTGESWAQQAGSATDITVAPDGTVFILGTTPVRGGFEVLRLSGSSWEQIVGGAGIAISAGSKAVFVAQDATTNLVFSSTNERLRAVDHRAETTRTASTAAPGSGANEVASGKAASSVQPPAMTTAASPGVSSADASANGSESGGSSPLPSAGSVVGAVGALGGLLGKGASVAASLPVPVPPQGAIAGAVGAAAAGAAASAATGAVTGTVGNVIGGVGNAVSSAAPGAPPSDAAQAAPAKATSPEGPSVPSLSSARPAPRIPLPGSLRCPIIGGGATMERGCELVGRAALKLWNSSSASCETHQAPPGYGTPFRDSSSSGCWVCPLPLQRSLTAVTSLTKGNLAACFGKAKELLVWQFGQYPEDGSYRFMPGLLSTALADPKAVDAFLEKRADGDTARKREMWAAMIADPAGSAELKALLFASLLRVAKQDSSTAAAREALGEFESYMRARRTYVADEALRMYRKARDVDSYLQQAKDSGGIGRLGADAAGSVITDFKTYAWSAVLPDSAGTAFIIASSALSQLGVSGEGVADGALSSLNVRFLEPVTKALDDQLGIFQAKGAALAGRAGDVSAIAGRAAAIGGADPAMIGSTLLGGAMKFSKGFMRVFGRDDLAVEYEKYVEEMKAPVRVREMIESTNQEDRQALLLFWALATSAHKASDTIGTGAMTGSELCNADAWTAAECSSAKALVLAAAKAAGYSN